MIDIKINDWHIKLTKQNLAFLFMLILSLYLVYGFVVSLFFLIIISDKNKSIESFKNLYNLKLSQIEFFNLNRKTVVDFITIILLIIPAVNFILLILGNAQGKSKDSETYWLPTCKVEVAAEISSGESGPAIVNFKRTGLSGTEKIKSESSFSYEFFGSNPVYVRYCFYNFDLFPDLIIDMDDDYFISGITGNIHPKNQFLDRFRY